MSRPGRLDKSRIRPCKSRCDRGSRYHPPESESCGSRSAEAAPSTGSTYTEPSQCRSSSSRTCLSRRTRPRSSKASPTRTHREQHRHRCNRSLRSRSMVERTRRSRGGMPGERSCRFRSPAVTLYRVPSPHEPCADRRSTYPREREQPTTRHSSGLRAVPSLSWDPVGTSHSKAGMRSLCASRAVFPGLRGVTI